MSSSNEAFKFQKLKGTNYHTWSEHMEAALQSKYLWLVVNGTETCPAAPPATKGTMSLAEFKAEKKDYLDWLLRDEAAKGAMKGACEDSQLPHVKGSKTSKDMWDALRTVHVTNQARINAHYSFEDLYTRKYVDGSSMANHIAAMLDIRRQITDAGETLEKTYILRVRWYSPYQRRNHGTLSKYNCSIWNR